MVCNFRGVVNLLLNVLKGQSSQLYEEFMQISLELVGLLSIYIIYNYVEAV